MPVFIQIWIMQVFFILLTGKSPNETENVSFPAASVKIAWEIIELNGL